MLRPDVFARGNIGVQGGALEHVGDVRSRAEKVVEGGVSQATKMSRQKEEKISGLDGVFEGVVLFQKGESVFNCELVETECAFSLCADCSLVLLLLDVQGRGELDRIETGIPDSASQCFCDRLAEERQVDHDIVAEEHAVGAVFHKPGQHLSSLWRTFDLLGGDAVYKGADFWKVSCGSKICEETVASDYSKVSDAYRANGDYLVSPEVEASQLRIKADNIVILDAPRSIERLELAFIFHDTRMLASAP